MKRKFWFLTKLSLKKKMASKWFIAVNIILALAIIALTNINSIITFFGGDFNEEVQVFVLEQETNVYNTFEQVMKTNSKSLNDVGDKKEKIKLIKTAKNVKEVKDNLEDNDILVIFENDPNDYLKAQVISKEKIDNVVYQVLLQSLNGTKASVVMMENNINPVILAKISSGISVDRVVLSDAKSADESMDMIMSTVFPTIILPFFMLTIFLVQMVGGEICEEKTTKSMEIIISNVSPKIHLGSKILASNLFVITQGLLLFLYGFIGLVIGGLFSNGLSLPEGITSVWNTLVESGFVAQLVYLIPLALILMVLSFIAYALVAGILASMTTNMEDFQQVQTPIMMITLAGYYLAITAGMFQGSILLRVLSYVPFLSCLVSPSLLLMGQIGIIDVIVSIAVLILFIFVLVKYGLKIYKIGILNYSNEKVWSRLAKAVKAKDI